MLDSGRRIILNDQTMQQILNELKIAHRDTTSQSHELYWSKMHLLAEAQYLPAVAFFLACLDDSRADWREDCLTCLGFHYQLPPSSQILEKIRQVLLTDPNSFVRLAAASILGSRSTPSDPALIAALHSDPDEDVRFVVFEALLTLHGVPFSQIRSVVERLKKTQSQPTLEAIARVRRKE